MTFNRHSNRLGYMALRLWGFRFGDDSQRHSQTISFIFLPSVLLVLCGLELSPYITFFSHAGGTALRMAMSVLMSFGNLITFYEAAR